MTNKENSAVAKELEALSVQDFLSVGLDHMVYIRPESTGKTVAYNIYAADGTHLATQRSWDLAVALAQQNNMDPAMIH